MFPLPDLRTGAIWALSAALVLALAGLGVEHAGRLALVAEFETFKGREAQQEQQRERVARENAQEVARLQGRHATRQQELIDAFYQARIARLERERRDAAGLGRLYNLADAYAARRGAATEGDTPSCRLAKAGLRDVTELLKQGAGMVAEGRSLVLERDAELGLWIGIGANDRALTAP